MSPIPSIKRQLLAALASMATMAVLCGFCLSTLVDPALKTPITRTSAWAIGAGISILAIANCMLFARRLWAGVPRYTLHALTGLLTGVFALLLHAFFTAGIDWLFSTSDLLLKLAFVLSGTLSAADYYFFLSGKTPPPRPPDIWRSTKKQPQHNRDQRKG